MAKTLKDVVNEAKKLDLDTFGEIMDKFIEEAHIQMLIEIPENSMELEFKDNIGAGPVLQLYILINALTGVLIELCDPDKLGLDPDNLEDFLGETLEMVKCEVVEAVKGGDDSVKAD